MGKLLSDLCRVKIRLGWFKAVYSSPDGEIQKTYIINYIDGLCLDFFSAIYVEISSS